MVLGGTGPLWHDLFLCAFILLIVFYVIEMFVSFDHAAQVFPTRLLIGAYQQALQKPDHEPDHLNEEF